MPFVVRHEGNPSVSIGVCLNLTRHGPQVLRFGNERFEGRNVPFAQTVSSGWKANDVCLCLCCRGV
jgi:hypothetical protein